MSLRAIQLTILLTALTLTACTYSARADELDSNTFVVKLFGCQLPVPITYAINGRELDRIVLSRDSGEIGRIVIAKFSGYSDNYEVTGEKQAGHLVVAELVNHRQWHSADYDMSIIRDDEYIVALMGAARSLKDSLVKKCISSGHHATTPMKE